MQKHMESANGNQTMIQPYRPFQDKLPIITEATLPTYGSFCNDESSIPVTSSLNVLQQQAIQILVMPRILLPKRNHKVETWYDNQPVLFRGVYLHNEPIILQKCPGTPMYYTTNFNFIDLLKCHFRVHNIAVLSFRADMIIIQTMVDPYRMPNINTKGLYTTIVPLSSLKEYDYDCSSCGEPLNEVNVVISKAIVLDLPSGSKIECINVVKGDPFRSY